MKLMAAPMQGYTDAVWRSFHRRHFGDGATAYVTPFIRLEKGVARERDLRDFTSPLNADDCSLEAQLIFRDAAELSILLDAATAVGATRVNLNLGCPFPLQTRRGRGAGLLPNPEILSAAVDILAARREAKMIASVSVKMRTGLERPDEWRGVLPIIERLNPAYIAIHPRTARLQYSGRVDTDAVRALLDATAIPVIFNGDILRPEDIADIMARFPGLAGVMAGRGLMARPSMFMEYARGVELPEAERRDALVRLHDDILAYKARTLCGDAQVLACVRPFWDFSEGVIGHKAMKAIRKAPSLNRYLAAVAAI